MPTSSTRTRNRSIVIGLGVVLVLAAAGALYWFFNRSVPEEANLASAVESVTGSSTTTTTIDPGVTTTAGATTTTIASSNDPGSALDGTWTVDTSIGEFSFEEASATFAGFRVKEVLSGIGDAEAVGRSPEVSGSMELAGSTVTAATFEVNMTAIITNDSRRDRRVQSAIKASEFPTATFTLTDPIDFGQIPADGEMVMAIASGDLTVAGVTNPVQMSLEAQVVDGDKIIVVGSTTLEFSDFGVTVPSAPIVVSAEDGGILEVQLWFTR